MNKSPSKPSGDLNSRLPALGELRHISFSKDALVMAVKLYYAASKKPLPPGVVEACEPRPDRRPPHRPVVERARTEAGGDRAGKDRSG